ncbi:hypothetical protein Tco_0863458 [Tanacetum coccineum]|uniref:Uncharacterized protein n=1 Tax=Tanacetum coccineum TaxID=301880 RepID=A0ABQ5H3S4_9ASTR
MWNLMTLRITQINLICQQLMAFIHPILKKDVVLMKALTRLNADLHQLSKELLLSCSYVLVSGTSFWGNGPILCPTLSEVIPFNHALKFNLKICADVTDSGSRICAYEESTHLLIFRDLPSIRREMDVVFGSRCLRLPWFSFELWSSSFGGG